MPCKRKFWSKYGNVEGGWTNISCIAIVDSVWMIKIYGNTVPKLHSLDIISNSSEILTFCWEVIILWICSRDSRFRTHNSLADAFLSPKPSWESCQNQKHTSASGLWCCPSGMGKLWALVCLRDCEGLLPIGPSQSLISASMSSVGYLNDTISTRCFNPSEAFM